VVCGTGGADLRLTTSGAVSADPLPGCAVIYIRMSVRSCWMLLVSCVTFVGRTWLLSFPVHPNKRSAASNWSRPGLVSTGPVVDHWWCAHYHQKSEGHASERHWHQAACASIQVMPGSGCYSARGQYARPWEPSVLRDYEPPGGMWLRPVPGACGHARGPSVQVTVSDLRCSERWTLPGCARAPAGRGAGLPAAAAEWHSVTRAARRA
jgi:hypothetical protein